ncbi:MAG: 2-oxoglutarate dehydrogenase, E2 component, dihydrolipoamide succinyltransferase, partial [Acidobacteriota bacterium]|nr:2-oxoglutarate dehydrogenase, E2 component, dihydrolipoamide succinyltransferase [Acidobacteriota bacterium]
NTEINGEYMSVEVVMPQMGESITEGTISKWLKAVGDKIERDEPLLEISTDKVDAEVPSPGAGVLLEIRTQEGETVEVGTVVAVVGAEGESSANGSSSAQPMETPAETPKVEEAKFEPVQSQTATATSSENSATPATSENSANSENAGNAAEVVMPQMGESITEGTVSKWLKAVGDKIEKDEPLLEISTDKVDAEVPSPSAGVLLEIRVNEGETVEVGSIVALVGAEGASLVQSPKSEIQSQTSASGQQKAVEATAGATGADVAAPAQSTQQTISMPAEEKREVEETEGRSYDYGRPGAVGETEISANGQSANGRTSNGEMSLEDLRKTKSSPLVRNIAKEHGVDISRLQGSGMSGRVTKKDILSFIESGAALRPQDLLLKNAPSFQPQTVLPSVQKPQYNAPQVAAAVGDRTEPMSVMRKKIAEHMTFSKQTSAHVTSVYEIDMTSVAKFRDKNKNEFQTRYGTKLSFMPFIFQAVSNALRKFPIVNSQVSGEQIIYKGDINLGMAVALDWGLIVPVIKRADTLSLSGLALSANDLADRARAKKLMPDEVQGGTFTITNPGVFGGLFGTPIINQPQVAILCVGTIEKRPKVITTAEGDDVIAIRSMAYFALTYDHRVVDGADAERFLSFMKENLENTQFSL